MRRAKRRSGFTLVEMLIVVAILGIVTLSAPQLFTQITRFFRQNQARVDIQRDARTVFDLMGRTLRQAQASTIVVDQLAGQPPYSRVYFKKVDGTEITYYQEGRKLYLVDVGTKAIAENLRYLAFSHPQTDNDKLVSVALTLEKSTYEGRVKALQLSVEKIRLHND